MFQNSVRGAVMPDAIAYSQDCTYHGVHQCILLLTKKYPDYLPSNSKLLHKILL